MAMTPEEERWYAMFLNAEAAVRDAEKSMLENYADLDLWARLSRPEESQTTDLEQQWLAAAEQHGQHSVEMELDEDAEPAITMEMPLDVQIEAFARIIAETYDHNEVADPGDRIVYLLLLSKVNVINQLLDAWLHYQDHQCPEGVEILDDLIHNLLKGFAGEANHVLGDEEEDEDGDQNDE